MQTHTHTTHTQRHMHMCTHTHTLTQRLLKQSIFKVIEALAAVYHLSAYEIGMGWF